MQRPFQVAEPEIGFGRFIGLDVSEPAIRYANQADLPIDGVLANLETDPLSARDSAIIAPVDVPLSTGSIGYVTERACERLLGAVSGSPWVISFVLRKFPTGDSLNERRPEQANGPGGFPAGPQTVSAARP